MKIYTETNNNMEYIVFEKDGYKLRVEQEDFCDPEVEVKATEEGIEMPDDMSIQEYMYEYGFKDALYQEVCEYCSNGIFEDENDDEDDDFERDSDFFSDILAEDMADSLYEIWEEEEPMYEGCSYAVVIKKNKPTFENAGDWEPCLEINYGDNQNIDVYRLTVQTDYICENEKELREIIAKLNEVFGLKRAW